MERRDRRREGKGKDASSEARDQTLAIPALSQHSLSEAGFPSQAQQSVSVSPVRHPTFSYLFPGTSVV